ncbi:unnamed protein product [Caenorhabditis angaria]|uniref:SCP domain-containing protein n=1 Tax=Caenorhabditis angaria TaxID=860376 RepID=A0A9P1IL36_9PELO|nr:unnamed protein product [Caenorhabditis angaria]
MIPFLFISIILSPSIFAISVHHAAAKHLLDTHNIIRSSVARGEQKIHGGKYAQPSSNMRKLVWDPKLAEKAQNYVNKNHPKEPRNFHGENLYQVQYKTVHYDKPHRDAQNAMKEWEAELSTIAWSPNAILCEDFKKIRNGLQIIRATTGSVGCAFHEKDMHGVLVCMYDGDMATSAISEGKNEIYKVGEACSACPIDSKCDKESGLCVGESESIPKDSTLANLILSRHNKERSKIANGNAVSTNRKCALRPASNMNKLTWDSELAWAAEQYAKARASEKRWMSGENIYYEEGNDDSNPERLANSAMTSWLTEIMEKSWNLDEKLNDRHYREMGNGLQMIWADTEKVGCGLYQWKSEDGARNYASFVCRYGDWFFEHNKKVYTYGGTCTTCDEKCSETKNDEPGLCVK